MKDWTFRSLSNGSKIDLIPYTEQKLAVRDDVSFYIGCDSQNRGRSTHYGLVIVFHYGKNGGHVVYATKTIPRVKDKADRLLREAGFSIELAQYLESHGIKKPDFIDLDFNPDPKYQSNMILRSALGWVEAMGYKARCKPDAVSASYVADKICHG